MNEKIQEFRKEFQALSKEEKETYISKLKTDELRFLLSNPELFLFDKQIISGDDWMFYLLRCGRGFGKSFAGAAWVAKKIRQGAKLIGLCGPTYDDVAKVMVPGIISWFLPDELESPAYNSTSHTIRFKSGALIYCYTSDKPTKGPNLEYLWCDEIGLWCDGIPDKIKERFEDIVRAVRVGDHPQTVITSTPLNHPFFVDFQKKIDGYNTAYRMIQGSMLENPTLPETFIRNQIAEYGGSSRGRQEIYGDLITDTPGAYFTYKMIDESRAELPSPLVQQPKRTLPSNAVLMGYEKPTPESTAPRLIRVVIGFDPSVSVGGDECGIIIAALYSNHQAYVLEDCSEHYDPNTWANLIAKKYREYDAAAIVAEVNQGGDMVINTLRTANALMRIIPRHIHQGKTTRAEHISSLYSQGKVHHTKVLKQLEDQMCSFNINYSKSPDRLDALGLALTELFWPTGVSGQQVSIANLPSRN